MPQLKFYEEIRNYEKTECPDERKKLAKSIYDNFIMKEMLSHTHVSLSSQQLLHSLIIYFDFHLQEYSKECVAHVNSFLQKNEVPANLFEPYIEEIFNHLRSDPFKCFMESSRYTRFLQWKNLELNLKVSGVFRSVKDLDRGRWNYF